ncbi:calcium-binding protein [Albimonas sp. CAU 1670]|uniref:calcium-binding protein n=1 Tax=Albimonas sp. CAU 1670 TaxID=3032599 RepID=UPI0023D9EE13|nr:calcium-binding protein [Albimonas sp. CAU 1670]MDF2235184.1 calcium-binding protein [Albimonas sp. CAU 1670]
MAARVKVIRSTPGVSVFDDPQPFGGDFPQTLLESSPVQNRRREVVFEDGALRLTVEGRIRYDGGEVAGGRADKMTFEGPKGVFQAWTGLDWDLASLMDRVDDGGLDAFLAGAFARFVVTGGRSGVEALATGSADVMVGSGVSDGLYGLGGNDRIFGEGGHDYLDGGAGDDRILGANGDDQIRGEAGDDRLFGGDGYDNLGGGAGDDVLSAGVGGDFLTGDAGNDRLGGWKGNDKLYGGAGKDRLLGSSGRDKLFGDAGDDALYGGEGRDRLIGGDGVDLLSGGKRADVLIGTDAGDDLRGGDGADALYGGDGAQTLNGGAGDDLLQGFGGIDAFDFRGGAFGTDRADIALAAGAADAPGGGAVEERLLLDAGATILVYALDDDGTRVYAFDVIEGGAGAGTVITAIAALDASDPGAEAERLEVAAALQAAIEQDAAVL